MAGDLAKNAVLLKRIEVTAAGFACQMRVGDLSGDGRLDIVMIQPDIVSDERYFPHSVSAATAYTPDGEILWQIGKPSYDENICTTDIPAQIYDIDRDGNNEFLCVMNGEFCVFDGKTGELKRKNPLPDMYAHDCFAIADLEGKGYPQNIILKNRYHQLWAMDFNFNVMWTYKGNVGHFPIVCDINHDGRDEIIAGGVVLSSDGEVMWEFDGVDFPKSILVADFGMSGNEEILIGGEKTALYDNEGILKWQIETNAKTNTLSVGNFRPDTFGFEVVGFFDEEEWENAIFLIDHRANTLFKEKRTDKIERSNISSVHNFDRTGREHIILADENATYLYDGYMNPLYVLNSKGHVLSADIFADGVAQVLIYDGQNVDIYSKDEYEITAAKVASPRPQTRSLYNYTEFSYKTADTKRSALGYAIGQFANPKIREWAEEEAQNITEEIMTRADFCVILTEALGLLGYSVDGFFDVAKNDYFYSAISTLKAYGYIDEIIGKFSPFLPTTAEFAITLIEKATKKLPLCLKSGEDVLTRQEVAKLILQVYQNM